MRISNLVLAYFMMGAMMWGGGVLTFEEAGVISAVVTNDGGQIRPNQQLNETMNEQNSVITGVVSAFGGGVLVVWNLIKILFGVLFWPIATLVENNAPPVITVLLGGGMTVSFYLSILALVSRSS